MGLYRDHNSTQNVNFIERWLSMLVGSWLTTRGLRRGGLPGMIVAALGGYLMRRGITGHCQVYEAVGVNTTNRRAPLPGEQPPIVTSSKVGQNYGTQADQAEGERSERRKSTRVGTTPGMAEGDRDTVEADLQSKDITGL